MVLRAGVVWASAGEAVLTRMRAMRSEMSRFMVVRFVLSEVEGWLEIGSLKFEIWVLGIWDFVKV
jgi:hypothetical protein